MKTPLRLALFCLLLVLFGSWFQQPISFGGDAGFAQRYPDDFPKVIRPEGPDFRADSIAMHACEQRVWNAYWAHRWDTMLYYSRKQTALAERLLEQRLDSVVIDYWASGYFCVGQAMVYLGDLEEGSRIINEALTIVRRLQGETLSLAMYHYALGHIAAEVMEDADLALDFYRTGEAIARRVLPPGDPLIINGIRNLGRGYWLKGDYDTAMKFYNSVLQREDLDPLWKGNVSWRVGNNFMEIEDWQRARYYYQLTAAYCKQRHVHRNESLLYEVLATQCLLPLGDLEAFKMGIAYCKRNWTKTHGTYDQRFNFELIYHVSLAKYYTILKAYDRSVRHYRLAERCSEQLGFGRSGNDALRLLQDITHTYLEADSLAAARATINELLSREAAGYSSADFLQNPSLALFTRQPIHLRTLELKGQILEKDYARTSDTRLLERALATYQLADSLVDRIRDNYRGVGAKNQLAGRSHPIYERAINCCFQMLESNGNAHYLDLAWQFAEKSKAVELLESLRETEAKQIAILAPEDQDQDKKIRRDLNFYEKLVYDERYKPTADSARISAWNRRIVGLKSSQDSLMHVFQKRYPEYFRLKYNRQTASLNDIQSQLPENTALVEYFMGDSTLFTFLIDRQQARLFRSAVDSGLHRDLATLRRTVHEYNPDQPRSGAQQSAEFADFTGAAHRLYRTLLAGPLTRSTAQKLIVVPDGVLGYVPFAALLRQAVDSAAAPDYRRLPWLVRTHAVRLAYSGTLFATTKPASAAGGYLGMAPSYSGAAIATRALPDSMRFTRAFGALRGGGVPALRYNSEEVDRAAAITGGARRTGEAATEQYFKAHAAERGILHLAAHALTNDSDPLYSTLLFAGGQPDSTGENDGLLHAYELYNLRLNADLAVLSACNTGAGKVVRGEGIMSLARAFKFAGCPNVLMSLWSVNDLSAKELVIEFFQQLQSGVGKAGALQAAQVRFLDHTRSDALTHPYYWAAFILVGDDAPVGQGGAAWWLWLLGGLAVIAGIWPCLKFWKTRQRRPG